jgi:hypothetical protein
MVTIADFRSSLAGFGVLACGKGVARLVTMAGPSSGTDFRFR